MTTEELNQINKEDHNRIESKVDRLVDCLMGNGQKGLKTFVAEHEQSLSNFRKGAWIIFTTIIGILIALIFGV